MSRISESCRSITVHVGKYLVGKDSTKKRLHHSLWLSVFNTYINSTLQKEKNLVFIGIIIRGRGRFKSIDLYGRQGNSLFITLLGQKNFPKIENAS